MKLSGPREVLSPKHTLGVRWHSGKKLTSRGLPSGTWVQKGASKATVGQEITEPLSPGKNTSFIPS
jgi:hypothetical protein